MVVAVLSDYIYGLCFVDSVEVEAFSAGSVRLKIRGAWPTPAWKFDHEELEFSGGRVTIKLVGKVGKGTVAPSVMAPFEHVVEVKGLEATEYIIEVAERGGRVVQVFVKREEHY
ncbi:MAG: hypothetical protein QXW47_06775 [Candidatus Jordarchaeales archaeon]